MCDLVSREQVNLGDNNQISDLTLIGGTLKSKYDRRRI